MDRGILSKKPAAAEVSIVFGKMKYLLYGEYMSSLLVWMDLEMSGLDPDRDVILEMATVITDSNLEIVEQGPSFVIRQPENLFNTMDDWNQKHHTESGLWQKVIASEFDLAAAENSTLDFLKKAKIQAKSAPLCGNSIWQDRRFIARYMKNLDAFLHYRNIDVSTIKELALRWYPSSEGALFKKQNKHRAIDDIIESISELKFYREKFFK
jgi:oligoribonuclease